jgi:broad specificity phosphatase PhoE
MKTKLIVIRHGQSEANLNNQFAGSLNVHLTQLGHKQACLAANALSGMQIDRIYSSDLYRAYETAVPTAQKLGLEIEKNVRLREISAGDWEGLTFDEIRERYPKEYDEWRFRLGSAVCPNGEAVNHMCLRILNEIDNICRKNEGKSICIFTHATPIRTLCAVSSGIPVEQIEREPFVPNASISIFEYENGEIKAIEKGNTEHLAGSVTALPNTI